MHSVPKLSLIIGARNDRYMGNFSWRFETTLNYLGANLEHLGRLDDVEVVLTDWGSEVPLHEVLTLNSPARQIVRFVLVPPAFAQELQSDSEFPIVLAQNVGVRRSRGEYIAQTDSDILFTREFLERLFGILNHRQIISVPLDRSLLVSKRRQVTWKYVIRRPNIQELDGFLHCLGRFLLTDPMFPVKGLHLYTATGFVMMHRSLWEDCQGYDQRLIHWGWMDIDLALRIASRYPWAFLEMFGLPEVFHLEHYPSRKRDTSRKHNPMRLDNVFRPNHDGWGLERYSLQEFVYPSVQEELAALDSKNLQSFCLNYSSLSVTAEVVLASVWRHLKQAAVSYLRKYMPEWLFAFLPVWRRRSRVVWNQLKGQSVTQWPELLRGFWMERQQERQRPPTATP